MGGERAERAAEAQPVPAAGPDVRVHGHEPGAYRGTRRRRARAHRPRAPQVIGTFLEIGLPFILRGIGSLRSGGGKGAGAKGAGSKKKRVGFEDEAAAAGGDGKEERELLERVRSEVALPEYTLFADYSEMVTQFGYVALWSTIWPLAPGASLSHARCARTCADASAQ